MTMSYSRNLSEEDFSTYNTEPEDLITTVLERKRWQKKTMKARLLIGVLTGICCILIVILIVTYESGRKQTACKATIAERAATDVLKFIHLADIHYDPFYNKTIDKTAFCRSQEGSKNTAKYVAEFGRIGCDSPASLFENSLDAIKNVSHEEGVSFVLLTGKSTNSEPW